MNLGEQDILQTLMAWRTRVSAAAWAIARDAHAAEDIFNKDKVHEREIHVLYDYANFHGRKGRKGSVNYLYADGHIGDREVE